MRRACDPEKTQTLKKLMTPSRAAKKKTRAITRAKPNKQSAVSTRTKPKPAAPSAKLEVRRAVPLDYVTTSEVDLRSTPDLAAPKLSGGSLGKGSVVKIAPQDWWYVEVERPATASGVLRGWLLNAVLRRATDSEEKIAPQAPEVAAPQTPSEALSDPGLRKKIARSIVNFEARRDAQGHLRVYSLPAGDGGGRYEVAGINERYHPQEAAKLRDLINAGDYEEAEDYATEVIAQYTDIVSKWRTVPGIEAYLRDCVFNRGPGGAAKILQMALGVKVDGRGIRNVKRAPQSGEGPSKTSRGTARGSGTVRDKDRRTAGEILAWACQPLG